VYRTLPESPLLIGASDNVLSQLSVSHACLVQAALSETLVRDGRSDGERCQPALSASSKTRCHSIAASRCIPGVVCDQSHRLNQGRLSRRRGAVKAVHAQHSLDELQARQHRIERTSMVVG